ncbi:hypothetical protein CGQ24_07385 [Arthrobacter sp. 7749]|nr:hypothetical protein CGQ24_07385 [Arthrobacter sp. 7749]
MSENITPEEFDVDAWILGANLPEESAEIYMRADVVGNIQALQRKITAANAVDAVDPERPAASKSKTAKLVKEYENLLNVFSDSRATVFVRAIDPDKMAALRHATEVRYEGKPPQEANAAFGYELLAESIVAIEDKSGVRKTARMNPTQLKKLESGIGPAQLKSIMEARARAQMAMPDVDADFLLKLSGTNDDSQE